MSSNLLKNILDRTPGWLRLFNRDYQVKTVLRMNELLRSKGMSQKELSEKTGWSKGYVSRLLSGGGNLTLRTVAKFEDAVGARVLHVTKGVPHAQHLMEGRVTPDARDRTQRLRGYQVLGSHAANDYVFRKAAYAVSHDTQLSPLYTGE